MPEPKKRRNGCLTFLLIGLGGIILLVILGVVALSLGGDEDGDDAAPTASESASPSTEDSPQETTDEEPEETSTEPEETQNEPEESESAADGADEEDSGLGAAGDNALRAARNYLDFSAFSRQGLIDQLSSEYGDQYSVEDATAAVDALESEVDWNEQAARSARNYLDFSPFSRQGLIDQLSSEYGEQFTVDQATAGVDAIESEVDWNEQAAEAARNYLEISPFSRQELIDQLSSEYGEQFTVEQATYGVDQTDL